MTTPEEVNAAFDACTDTELSKDEIAILAFAVAVLMIKKRELDLDDDERATVTRLHELLRGAGGVVVSAVEK